jgi:DNA-binding CsgD family transcriptional regulator
MEDNGKMDIKGETIEFHKKGNNRKVDIKGIT